MNPSARRPASQRPRRLASVLLPLLAAACLRAAPTGLVPLPETTPAAAPPRTPTPSVIAVSDIPGEAVAFEALRREIARRLIPGGELLEASRQVADVETRVRQALARRAFAAPEEVQLVELQDFESELREVDAASSRLDALLTTRARALDTDLAQLRDLGRRWAATLPAAVEAGAPEPILDRAREVMASIEKLEAEVKQRRDEALTLLDVVSRARAAIDAAKADASDRRSRAQRRLFAIAEAPIWRTSWMGQPIGRIAGEQLLRDMRRVNRYFRQTGPGALVRLFLWLLLTYTCLRLLRGPAREAARVDAFSRAPLRVIEKPFAPAMLSALLLLDWTTPAAPAPILFLELTWLLLILSASAVLRRLLGSTVQRTLFIVTAVACLVPLRYLYEQDPLLDRLVLILQVGAVGVTLAADLATGKWKQVFPVPRWQRFVTVVIVVILATLAAALVLVVIGYVGTARLLRTGAIGSLGLGLVSLGAYSLAYGLASALLTTRPARIVHIVQSRPEVVRRFLRRLIAVLVVVEWILWTLAAFNASEVVRQGAVRFLGATFTVGSATISVRDILTFLGVLAGTFLLTAVLKLFLDGEVLSRLKLKRGVAFMISTTVRYAVVVSGVLLAFSAVGISLSKVTLLAGALGVGLGFGLQNLVSNFVSGLILLFERPIQVGDMVDVGSLVGEVRRIGMRSSTVRTADGAEVVVPNADLISKSVVNWTLSDRRRRIEVKVGVAYGADPEKVIDLLLQAAAGHPEALADPPPAAYFMGFGDSSLDFVLQVWVARFEQGLALQSAVRRAVHRILGEAGIEIPFPQRDLNVRSVAPDVVETLRGRKDEPAG